MRVQIAATKSSAAIHMAMVLCDPSTSAASGSTSANARDPNAEKIRNIAIMNPTSPMRLTTKAFLAALAYARSENQKPMSR